jgi:hypothetical protein
MGFGSAAVLQHDDGLVDSALFVEWFKERSGTQAFAASFPAGSQVWTLEAIAWQVCRIGGLKTELTSFRRGRTHADRLLSYAMSQRANQALEPMPIAVTAAAFAPAAPSTGMAHL